MPASYFSGNPVQTKIRYGFRDQTSPNTFLLAGRGTVDIVLPKNASNDTSALGWEWVGVLAYGEELGLGSIGSAITRSCNLSQWLEVEHNLIWHSYLGQERHWNMGWIILCPDAVDPQS